ncbi:MAG TPA: aminodeoxychorismate synthase component I [Prolixibacteraceae bacterium]|nr:aminodeoxychorismate synthase component I [Prolixibacteraceae bacterium]
METLYCKDYISKMNQWGKARKPFIFILDFELKNPVVLPLDKAAENGIYFTFNNHESVDIHETDKSEFTFRKIPVSYEVFKKSFDQVLTEIKLGNSFLTNLTFPTTIETNLTLREIFYRSEAPYKLLFKNQFVVFSPELFITIRGGTIASYPMKGTIDASIPNAKIKILNDLKETAEHHTIVDLIRNDLSMVSTNVKVEKFRFIDTVRTHDKVLLQVSSEVTGQLPEDYYCHLGDILSKLLPAGSICGAPKIKTLEIINQSEIYDRGYYSGVFGIFDGTDLQSAVMIRFIEKRDEKFIFKSGGGITSMSNPEEEYQELIDKVYVPIY